MSLPKLRSLGAAPTPQEIRSSLEEIRLWFLRVQKGGGIATASDISKAVSGAVEGNTTIINSSEGGGGGEEPAPEPPTAPTGVTATPLFSRILWTWDAPTYAGHAYTEYYRAETNDLGQAQLAGRAFNPDVILVDDSLPETSLGKTYYGWFRHVNTLGEVGPYNAAQGIPATTKDDPDYLLEIASEKWKPTHDYALGDFVLPTRPNGYVYEATQDGGVSAINEPVWPTEIDATVNDGDLTWTCKAEFSFETFFKVANSNGVPRLTLKELYLADGIIKRAMIGELAVGDANIENVTVAKLLAGVITASNIFLGGSQNIHLDGGNESIDITDDNETLRVRIGKLTSGWGIQIWDANGNVILNSGGVQWSGITGAGKPKSKIVDSSTWQIGTDGSQPGFIRIGTDAENLIIPGATPHNVLAPVWECGNDADSDQDGGWITDLFDIDPTQTYRFSVCFKRNNFNGTTYLGVYANTVRAINNGPLHDNPYFWNGDPPELNKWYLAVGYVYPHTYSGSTHRGGVYDMETGEKVASSTSFRWDPAITTTRHRAYFYYSTDTASRQWFWDPRVELCDGTEQTIESMLMGSAIVTANSDFVQNVYPADKADLQAQIDGKIDTWYQSTDPSLSWSGTNASHADDMWWNTTPGSKELRRWTGTAWTAPIEDQKAIDAFANAATAQDTADGKRRVFVSTPVPPYDVGDLWDRGSTLGIWRCKTARTAGQSYSIAHWQVSADTTASNPQGAGWLTDLVVWSGNKILGTNVGTYMDSAAIKTLMANVAYINSLNVNGGQITGMDMAEAGVTSLTNSYGNALCTATLSVPNPLSGSALYIEIGVEPDMLHGAVDSGPDSSAFYIKLEINGVSTKTWYIPDFFWSEKENKYTSYYTTNKRPVALPYVADLAASNTVKVYVKSVAASVTNGLKSATLAIIGGNR